MPSMLYYVQDEQGREVVSAHVDVEKVGDVTAHREEGYDTVELRFEDIVIERGRSEAPNLTLHRVPSDDKLAAPVSHPIK